MDKQRDVRKHIAAAKGWLSKADDSLEQENDIQGDLKLMLAHAELQRAQEKNAQKLCVRWFKRLAPPLVACLLALAGIIYSQDSKPETEPEHAIPVADKPSLQAEAPAAYPVQEQPEEPGYSRAEAVMPPAGQPQAEEKAVDIQKENNAEVELPSLQQEPEVPAREIQQLMQSAGSILRE